MYLVSDVPMPCMAYLASSEIIQCNQSPGRPMYLEVADHTGDLCSHETGGAHSQDHINLCNRMASFWIALELPLQMTYFLPSRLQHPRAGGKQGDI